MSAVTTYITRAKPKGGMWLRTSALYTCLGCVNWFVSYKPLIVPQGNIMILPLQGNILTFPYPQHSTTYMHTGGALIYVIGINISIFTSNVGCSAIIITHSHCTHMK